MSPAPARKARHTLLVAGAGGVVGAAAVEHFAALPDWEVIAVSRRRPPELPEGVTHVRLDLTTPPPAAPPLPRCRASHT